MYKELVSTIFSENEVMQKMYESNLNDSLITAKVFNALNKEFNNSKSLFYQERQLRKELKELESFVIKKLHLRVQLLRKAGINSLMTLLRIKTNNNIVKTDFIYKRLKARAEYLGYSLSKARTKSMLNFKFKDVLISIIYKGNSKEKAVLGKLNPIRFMEVKRTKHVSPCFLYDNGFILMSTDKFAQHEIDMLMAIFT